MNEDEEGGKKERGEMTIVSIRCSKRRQAVVEEIGFVGDGMDKGGDGGVVRRFKGGERERRGKKKYKSAMSHQVIKGILYSEGLNSRRNENLFFWNDERPVLTFTQAVDQGWYGCAALALRYASIRAARGFSKSAAENNNIKSYCMKTAPHLPFASLKELN